MTDNDRLFRFIIENTNVRGEMVHLDATWQAVLQRAAYPPTVRNILGEALAACALLSATIKFEGSLIMQIRGDGPLHLLVVQASPEGTLRGIARWHADVPEKGLDKIFGNGQLVITIEPPKNRIGAEPYQGIIALQGDRLCHAIENYFRQSEQLNTRLWLAADAKTCGGFLLQELPVNSPDTDAWPRAMQLADTLTANEILHLPVIQVLHRLFHEEDIRLFDAEPVSFRCSCSRERIDAILLSMGTEETHQILDEQGTISVDCEFCNAHYEYDAVDIDTLYAHNAHPDKSSTRH
ncbi:MAG: 33 kDa chaperonin HslO [Pseudomonadota bacterium]|nr:33 kDa chaperonin HslO [Pseudomonadota bacterium]